jgi:hypothetical protein
VEEKNKKVISDTNDSISCILEKGISEDTLNFNNEDYGNF